MPTGSAGLRSSDPRPSRGDVRVRRGARTAACTIFDRRPGRRRRRRRTRDPRCLRGPAAAVRLRRRGRTRGRPPRRAPDPTPLSAAAAPAGVPMLFGAAPDGEPKVKDGARWRRWTRHPQRREPDRQRPAEGVARRPEDRDQATPSARTGRAASPWDSVSPAAGGRRAAPWPPYGVPGGRPAALHSRRTPQPAPPAARSATGSGRRRAATRSGRARRGRSGAGIVSSPRQDGPRATRFPAHCHQARGLLA